MTGSGVSIGRAVTVAAAFLLAAVFASVRREGAAPAPPKARSASAAARGFSLSFSSGGRPVETFAPERRALSAWITASGTVQAGSEVAVGAPFAGRVAELLKDEGDEVREGEVLFRLDPREKQEALTEAELDLRRKRAAAFEAELELREAERRRARVQEEPEALTEARLQLRQNRLEVERTAAQLEAARSRLERARRLLNEGVGRESEVEAASSEFKVAQIAGRVAEEQLALARDRVAFREQTWETERAEAEKALALARSAHQRAQVDLEGAKVALERAKRELAQCEVRSPISGRVTARQVNQGEEVSRATGDVAHYIVSDLSHVLVYSDVDEGDVVSVRRGQPAEVTVNALGDGAPLEGKVYDVGYRARVREGGEVSTFRVRVLLAPGQERLARLRPGMTATARVRVEHVEDALVVPLQAVVQRERRELAEALPEDTWNALPASVREGEPTGLLDVLYVVEDGRATVRVIERGIQDEQAMQILAGLEEDAEVIVGPFRALRELRHGLRVEARPARDAFLTARKRPAAAGEK